MSNGLVNFVSAIVYGMYSLLFIKIRNICYNIIKTSNFSLNTSCLPINSIDTTHKKIIFYIIPLWMRINSWCSFVNACIQQIMRHGGSCANQTIGADCDVVDDSCASRYPCSRAQMNGST